jgi:sec-independent protein translocase protein TatC
VKKHFEELLYRLKRSLFVLGAAFTLCFYYSNTLYTLVSKPILTHLPVGTQIITTKVTAPFMVPLQLSFICALLLCAPYILYQIWMFVKPGLYKQERDNIVPVIFLSCILFYLGIAFGILVISPVALNFFTNSAPNGVTVMLDIASYLDFIVTIAFAAGVAFQIPVITSLLIRFGVFSKSQLASKRRHIIVLAFVLGMLLAPPDVISQVLLALPMWGLFELGLFVTPTQDRRSNNATI